jgi:hypothetical protein
MVEGVDNMCNHGSIKTECKHEHVKYCPDCGMLYCEDCGTEWSNKPTIIINPPNYILQPTWYPYWSIPTYNPFTPDYYKVTC